MTNREIWLSNTITGVSVLSFCIVVCGIGAIGVILIDNKPILGVFLIIFAMIVLVVGVVAIWSMEDIERQKRMKGNGK